VLGMLDPFIVDGRHNSVPTRWLPAPTEEVCAVLTDAAARATSPLSSLTLHHFHGAATRVPVASTAYGLRSEHLLVEIISTWEAGDLGDVHRQWAQDLAVALDAHALPGGYPNLLGPDEHERTRAAYGENLDKLLSLKKSLDPDGVFAAVPTLTV